MNKIAARYRIQTKTKNISLLMAFAFLTSLCAYADLNHDLEQGHLNEQKQHEQHDLSRSSRLTLGIGHTHVSEGKVEDKTKWLILPSWSLNYDYWLSNKFAIGLQNEVILESFIIEHGEEELLERSFPVSSVPLVLFKPIERLTVLLGIGAEFTEEKTLTMTRLGAEYGFHLPGNWEVGAALVWDNKWNYYNSWAIAFTMSKIWSKPKAMVDR